MIVANSASTCQPKPCLNGRARSVDRVAKEKLIVDSPTFARCDIRSIEAGGNQLRLSWVGEQIASQLFDGELIEWHVCIEGINNPIAIRPCLPFVVQVQPMRIAITGNVEPMLGHLLTEARRGKILVNELAIVRIGGIRNETLDIA